MEDGGGGIKGVDTCFIFLYFLIFPPVSLLPVFAYFPFSFHFLPLFLVTRPWKEMD